VKNKNLTYISYVVGWSMKVGACMYYRCGIWMPLVDYWSIINTSCASVVISTHPSASRLGSVILPPHRSCGLFSFIQTDSTRWQQSLLSFTIGLCFRLYVSTLQDVMLSVPALFRYQLSPMVLYILGSIFWLTAVIWYHSISQTMPDVLWSHCIV